MDRNDIFKASMKMAGILSICLFLSISVGAFAGVGSGGGGDEKEAQVIVRFWDVLQRVKSIGSGLDIREAVKAIEKNLKESPLEIVFTNQLVYCDTKAPIKEIKDAWGCPGKLQLLKSFPLDSDVLIFHELTRITPGYENFDEGYTVSISKLKLNEHKNESLRIEEIFPKKKYSRNDVENESRLRLKIGADATGIRDSNENYVLITYFPVIYDKNAKVEKPITFQR